MLGALAWILLVVGLFGAKLIGIELMAVFQISFFSLLTFSKVNPCVYTMRSLYLANGFNGFLMGAE